MKGFVWQTLGLMATLVGGCGGGDEAAGAGGAAGSGGVGGTDGGVGGAAGDAGSGTCPAPLADCNADSADGCEVDTSSHAQHCGACSQWCLGGVCSDGVCEPTAIGTVGHTDDLTLRTGFAYVSHTWDGYVAEVAIEPGSEPSGFWAGGYPDLVAATESDLFFSMEYEVPDGVVRYNFADKGTYEVAYGTMEYGDLQVHDHLVAWTDTEDKTVRVVDTAGSLNATFPASSELVAVRAGRAAWVDDGAVNLFESAHGTQPVPIANAPGSSGAIALSDEAVYFEDGGVLREVAIETGDERVLATGLGRVDSLVLTSSRVYLVRAGVVSWVARANGSVASLDGRGSKVATFDGGAAWVDAGRLMYQPDAPEPRVTTSCGALFADCNGSAADGCETAIGSDPKHCGACNKACDGPCRLGACQPLVLATATPTTSLELTDDQVIWSDYYTIYAVSKQGGPVRPLVDNTSSDAFIDSIATGQDQVYFSSDNAIWKVPVAGGTPVMVVDVGDSCGGVRTDGDDLYYLSREYVYRVPISGGTPVRVFDGKPYASYGVDVLGFAVEAGRLVVKAFVAGPTYYLFGVDGATTELQFASPHQDTAGLLVEGSLAVVAHNFDAGLFTQSLGGGALTRWSMGQGAAALAKDTSHYYWIGSTPIHCDQGCDFLYAMNRITKTGGTPEALFDIPGYPGMVLAVDETSLYFENGGYLVRISKTP
jgi:hypothetical protein